MCKHFFVKFFLAFSASLPILVPKLAYSQSEPRVYSIEAVNFPDHYIRHRNFLTYLEKINDDQASEDATFIIVNGLAGKCYSFKSSNIRGYFLRHQSFRLKLSKMTNDRLFRDDATFCLKKRLYDKNQYSFEAINFPNYYIRHVNFELRLEPFDGSMQFKKDATFYLREPVSPPVRFDTND